MRYYISSKALSAKELLNASRSHWLVESMHWMLDTEFGEDACRKREASGRTSREFPKDQTDVFKHAQK
ncbi:TPA: hypothetical protein I7719_09165 [Vibrio vulnificus]|nr:hypothetical protein [Vibrio vulnificus]